MPPKPKRKRRPAQQAFKTSRTEEVIKKMLELVYNEYINSIAIDHTSEKKALTGLIRNLGYKNSLFGYSVKKLRNLATRLNATQQQFDELQYEEPKKFTMEKFIEICLRMYRTSLKRNKNEKAAKKKLFNQILREAKTEEVNLGLGKLIDLETIANTLVPRPSEDQGVQSSTNKSNLSVSNLVSKFEQNKNGGKKSISKKTKKVRKHKGIYQRGPKKGKLKPGFKYSGKKTKTGLKIIVKLKK